MPDTRLHQRTTTCDAMWMDAGTARALPCTVANISSEGAQLCIGAGFVLPPIFALRATPHDAQRRICRLIWRRGDRAGVKFMAP